MRKYVVFLPRAAYELCACKHYFLITLVSYIHFALRFNGLSGPLTKKYLLIIDTK